MQDEDEVSQKELDELTMRGAWKMLCCHVLMRGIEDYVDSKNLWRIARGTSKPGPKWIDGNIGVITFEECCAVANIQPAVARQKIEEYAHSRRRERPKNANW